MLTPKQIKEFIKEDAPEGDVTSKAIFASDNPVVTAHLVAKSRLVVSGMVTIKTVIRSQFKKLKLLVKTPDGAKVSKGELMAVLKGPVQQVLLAERLILNLLQRLSGIATLTHDFVQAAPQVQILDTRKTTPGLRLLQRRAVKDGGGCNHRWGLSDQYLIKENHIEAAGSIAQALERVWVHKKRTKNRHKVQIEVKTVSEFKQAIPFQPDYILLDNMSASQIKKCVDYRNQCGRTPLLEISGGITLKTVKSYAKLGVERISVGALTHSAISADISLLIQS